MEPTVIGLTVEKVGEIGNKPDPPGAADTATVVIGTAGGGGIRYFLGMIDEVRIWNRALSDEEINEQMEKGHFEIFPVEIKINYYLGKLEGSTALNWTVMFDSSLIGILLRMQEKLQSLLI